MSDQGYEEMAKRHWEQMRRIEMELGMSPASQTAATIDLYRAQRDEWQRRAEAAEAALAAVPIAAIEQAYVRHCANDLYDDAMPMCAVGPWWEIVSWLRARQ